MVGSHHRRARYTGTVGAATDNVIAFPARGRLAPAPRERIAFGWVILFDAMLWLAIALAASKVL